MLLLFSIFKFISLIFGSFFIFTLTLTNLRKTLAEKADSKIKKYIAALTNNYHYSFLFGIFITVLLTSSTALTIVTIAFLSANIIKEKSAFALILGANIGTTLTAFLFSFNLGSFSFILIFFGLLLKLLRKNFFSSFLINLGILFFCLMIIELSIASIENNIQIAFSTIPILATLEGVILSIILNSSSTTIITAGLLYTNSSINLIQGISIMLGANIGTTITTLIYTFNQSKSTKKVIIYNILFNILGSLIFLCYIDYFIKLLDILKITYIQKQTIALSHLIFNLLTTIIIYIIFSFKKIQQKFFI